MRPVPPPAPRRPAEHLRPERPRVRRHDEYDDDYFDEYSDDSADYHRPPPRRPADAGRGRERILEQERRPSARAAQWDDEYGEPSYRASGKERGIRGFIGVLAVFLLTLAGAGVDSFVGVGLGLITMAALVGSTAVATLVVRRSDVLSLVVAPPLVFIAVAGVNIGLAPSASFNVATVATLLIRGFPTMALATVVALVIALIRLAARR